MGQLQIKILQILLLQEKIFQISIILIQTKYTIQEQNLHGEYHHY